VRISRFYQRCVQSSSSSFSFSSTASSRQQWALPDLSRFQCQPRAPDLSGHCRTSTATYISQRALLDLNRELQISVGTAGPQLRAPDLSGHCRTSTASLISQRALLDLNRELQISVGTAGPQLRAPDPSGQVGTAHSDLALAPFMSERISK